MPLVNDGDVPVTQVLGQCYVPDVVMHAWDLGRSAGPDVEPGASPTRRLVGFIGRDPEWTPPDA